jgi:hypothetical protein
MAWIRPLRTVFAWTSFALGIPFNVLAIWLIARHTPEAMRVYSKILLQTCTADIALLVLTVLQDYVGFLIKINFEK